MSVSFVSVSIYIYMNCSIANGKCSNISVYMRTAKALTILRIRTLIRAFTDRYVSVCADAQTDANFCNSLINEGLYGVCTDYRKMANCFIKIREK